MKANIKILLLVSFFFISASILKANEEFGSIYLTGKWKFSLGDNKEWSEPETNDDAWDEIRVPARWEEQGYHGYDGYAWYRKKVEMPGAFENRNIYLELGYIDDVDEVYFNGVKIGQSGSFPPGMTTAYDAFRRYLIPNRLIRYRDLNTIAVRVYDSQIEGGIVRGTPRVVAEGIAVMPDIDLSGYWNIETRSHKTDAPDKIMVPGAWENNGLPSYDGIATYSRMVDVPENMVNKKLIFLAGRIDDEDEFYINGKLIAFTGSFNSYRRTEKHMEYRNYFIPEGILKPGENLFEIKVLDRTGLGGIQEGQIGLIMQDNFIKYWRLKKQ